MEFQALLDSLAIKDTLEFRAKKEKRATLGQKENQEQTVFQVN